MSDQKLTLTVKHLSHNTYKIEIESDKTILQLKEKIQEQSEINPAEMKLIFKGKILKKDDEKLSDLNITDGCALHMVHNKPQQQQQPQNTLPNQQSQQTPQQNQQQIPPNPFMNQGMGMPGMGQGMQGMGMPGMGMPGMGQGMPGMGMPGMGQMDMAQAQQMLQNPQMRAMAQNLLSNPEMLRNMIQNNPMLQQMAQNNPQLQSMLQNPDQMRNLSNMMFGPTPQGQQQPGQTTQTQPGQQGQTQPGQTGMNQGQTGMNQGMPQFPMFNPGMFQNMQMPNMGQQQQPQGNQNYEEMYKDQLTKLEEMGFTNKQVNIDVLKQCYGNVDLAIERLLGGNNQ